MCQMQTVEGPQPSNSVIEVKRLKKQGRGDGPQGEAIEQANLDSVIRGTLENVSAPPFPGLERLFPPTTRLLSSPDLLGLLHDLLNSLLADFEVGQQWSAAFLELVQTNHYDRLWLQSVA